MNRNILMPTLYLIIFSIYCNNTTSDKELDNYDIVLKNGVVWELSDYKILNRSKLCTDTDILFPLETEWTYKIYSLDSNEYLDIVKYKAISCEEMNNRTWIVNKPLYYNDSSIVKLMNFTYGMSAIWDPIDSFMCGTVQGPPIDSTVAINLISIENINLTKIPLHFTLWGEENVSRTIFVIDDVRQIATFVKGPIKQEVEAGSFNNSYIIKLEYQHNPSNRNWDTYSISEFEMIYVPGVGIIKFAFQPLSDLIGD